MNSVIKKINLFAALLLILSFVLCSCTVEFEDDGGFIDKKTGIKYLPCSATLSLRPLKVEEEYCRYDEDNIFYTIQWQEPTEYLADYDVAEAALVFHSEDTEDITMANFEPIAAMIYVEGKASICIDKFYCEAKYLPDEMQRDDLKDDSALVYAIRDAMNDGEQADGDLSGADDEDVYFIRLTSAKYPGLYYAVVFFTDAYGDSYITDRSTGKTVVSPEALTKRMIG